MDAMVSPAGVPVMGIVLTVGHHCVSPADARFLQMSIVPKAPRPVSVAGMAMFISVPLRGIITLAKHVTVSTGVMFAQMVSGAAQATPVHSATETGHWDPCDLMPHDSSCWKWDGGTVCADLPDLAFADEIGFSIDSFPAIF